MRMTSSASRRVIGLLAAVGCVVSCAPTPESWSKDFADHATDCGAASAWEPGQGSAVFACARGAVASSLSFTAKVGVGVFPGVHAGPEASVLRGRVVGINVNGTYETFVFSYADNLWFGPCQTLDLGGGNTIAFAGCRVSRLEQLPPSALQARFLFDIPAADQGHIPWAP